MILILASNSPRRKQLLALGGWDFLQAAADVDESVLQGETAHQYVRRLALAKAAAAQALLSPQTLAEGLILASDTAVVDCRTVADCAAAQDKHTSPGCAILGKPADAGQAEEMLRQLRGRTHQVYTALALLRPADGRQVSEVCITDVPMRAYSDAEMRAYIASGDPLDKAGAYAIQHAGFRPVNGLLGCSANVMGLPVCRVAYLLAQFGLPAQGDVAAACQSALEYDCPIFQRVLHAASEDGQILV